MTQIESPVAKSTITYEEFLIQYAGENAEWVDGKVERMSPISVEHDDLSGWLYKMMSELVQTRDLGTVLHDKFQMKTGARLSGREPDIIFVAKTNLSRLKRTFLDGPADLVIEVISDDSVERDRVTKFAEYQQGGVGEYWILDPETRSQDFYVLGIDGRFERAHPTPEGIYRSTVLPSFWIEVAWLWQKPRPLLLSVLKAWGHLT